LARKVLKAALYLDLVESAGAGPRADGPASVEEAVKRLAADLSLKDRIEIAHMSEAGLSGLDDTLGEYIRERFGLRSGNLALLEACRCMAGRDVLLEEDASALIIRRLWESQGVEVSRLKRIRYGSVEIPSYVRTGEWVELEPKEVKRICKEMGIRADTDWSMTPEEGHRFQRQVKKLRSRGPGKTGFARRQGGKKPTDS
ncbi:MAG: DUF6794 domain-containing protein, partial [Porticoccaceae bacterium]